MLGRGCACSRGPPAWPSRRLAALLATRPAARRSTLGKVAAPGPTVRKPFTLVSRRVHAVYHKQSRQCGEKEMNLQREHLEHRCSQATLAASQDAASSSLSLNAPLDPVLLQSTRCLVVPQRPRAVSVTARINGRSTATRWCARSILGNGCGKATAASFVAESHYGIPAFGGRTVLRGTPFYFIDGTL